MLHGVCLIFIVIVARALTFRMRIYWEQCASLSLKSFSRGLIWEQSQVFRCYLLVVQALMYVLCFCMRSLMDIPRLKSLLLRMPIEAIFNHPLNPLKVKLPVYSFF